MACRGFCRFTDRWGLVVPLSSMTPLVHARPDAIPRLCAGDRLTRDEFERRYLAMPDCKKAELIEGVVYMPSPVSQAGWLARYRAATPGVSCGDNATVRLDLDNEPQPDLHVRLLPERGGRTQLGPE